MSDRTEKKAVEDVIQTLEELIDGGSFFDCTGYSKIRVTKNGKAKIVQVPIRTRGVAEYQREMAFKAPKPPIKRELIRKNSPEGVLAGLAADTFFEVFDLTDPAYVEAIEQHNREYIWQSVIFAIDTDRMKLKLSDGRIAETYDQKKQVLQGNGITMTHVNQIMADVMELSRFAEQRSDFLFDRRSA